MTEELTSEQEYKLKEMPERIKKIAIRISELDAPYCYAVLDAIRRYNHELDVPESVITAMGLDGMQIWADFLTTMKFVKTFEE